MAVSSPRACGSLGRRTASVVVLVTIVMLILLLLLLLLLIIMVIMITVMVVTVGIVVIIVSIVMIVLVRLRAAPAARRRFRGGSGSRSAAVAKRASSAVASERVNLKAFGAPPRMCSYYLPTRFLPRRFPCSRRHACSPLLIARGSAAAPVSDPGSGLPAVA